MNRTMKKTGRIFCESAHKVWSYPIAGAKGPTHRASGTADPPRGSMSRQPHLVGPAVGAEGYRMATMEVRAMEDAASSRQIIDRWWSGAAASYCLSWVWKVSAHSPPVHAGAPTTSYSRATPSGSFSSIHACATSSVAKIFPANRRMLESDLTATLRRWTIRICAPRMVRQLCEILILVI